MRLHEKLLHSPVRGYRWLCAFVPGIFALVIAYSIFANWREGSHVMLAVAGLVACASLCVCLLALYSGDDAMRRFADRLQSFPFR